MISDQEYAKELEWLKYILERLCLQRDRQKEELATYSVGIRERQKELWQDLYNLDAKEVAASRQSISETADMEMILAKDYDNVLKLLQSPYFGRIRFQEQEKEEATFYIGLSNFRDTQLKKILIYDWRAPVSSMFYDCELGQASYQAPRGLVEGELREKRQHKIRNGEMEYVFESSLNIQDSILQETLSKASGEQMKNIVETIQKEQNALIRDDKAETMVLQGVAGSGKTSIALHRIAYLLYKHRQTIQSENVLILSPNAVFASYISNVLPELGEEPVVESSFLQIALSELKGDMVFETGKEEHSRLEQDPDGPYAQRIRLKSSMEFLEEIRAYHAYVLENYFQPQDLEVGHQLISKEFLAQRFHAYRRYPICKRMEEISDDVCERLRDIPDFKLTASLRKKVRKLIFAMFKVNSTAALYFDFYTHCGLFHQLAFVEKSKLEYNDLHPYLLFKLYFDGGKDFFFIKHLVVDEMQDYTPVQYEIVKRMFSKAHKTILGDFWQQLNPYNQMTLPVFQEVFPEARVVEMKKSYRSTVEIIDFANEIMNNAVEIYPIDRHGPVPTITLCPREEDQWEEICARLAAFEEGPHASLALLCRDDNSAAQVAQQLSSRFPPDRLHLLTEDSSEFSQGITISSITMSKGLEFDAVLLLDVSRDVYGEKEQKLLFVGCTRAMHQLDVLSVTAFSSLLPPA